MAALFRFFECNLKGRYVLGNFEPLCKNTRSGSYLTKSNSINPEFLSEVDEEYIDDEFKLTEEDIERKRNKSRLQPHHRNVLMKQVPHTEPKTWFHKTVKYKQRLYGRYGEVSGVNPGIMWPTHSELEEIREYEAVAYPESIQEMIINVTEARKTKERQAKEREEEVLKKLAKLDQWKEELNSRIKKKEADAAAAKAKKDRLVEEVRRHFGFKIDPRDDRFKEMLEKKEKEDKKLVKEAKRKAKEAKELSKLLEISSKVNSTRPSHE